MRQLHEKKPPLKETVEIEVILRETRRKLGYDRVRAEKLVNLLEALPEMTAAISELVLDLQEEQTEAALLVAVETVVVMAALMTVIVVAVVAVTEITDADGTAPIHLIEIRRAQYFTTITFGLLHWRWHISTCVNEPTSSLSHARSTCSFPKVSNLLLDSLQLH